MLNGSINSCIDLMALRTILEELSLRRTDINRVDLNMLPLILPVIYLSIWLGGHTDNALDCEEDAIDAESFCGGASGKYQRRLIRPNSDQSQALVLGRLSSYWPDHTLKLTKEIDKNGTGALSVKISMLVSGLISESLRSTKSETESFSYSYFHCWRSDVHYNFALPGWDDKGQLAHHDAISVSLLPQESSFWFANRAQTELVSFFSEVMDMDQALVESVLQEVFAKSANKKPLDNLIYLIVSQVVAGSQQWLDKALHTSKPESVLKRYLTSVGYKTIDLLMHILEHPDEVNSNHSYSGLVYGKSKATYRRYDDASQKAVPYAIPKRLAGWAYGRKSKANIEKLNADLRQRSCIYHTNADFDY